MNQIHWESLARVTNSLERVQRDLETALARGSIGRVKMLGEEIARLSEGRERLVEALARSVCG